MSSVHLQRQPPRFDLKVDGQSFGQITLDQARGIRDACDAMIISETNGAETIIALTCLHFGQRRDALNHSRKSPVACARLTAMVLLKEHMPLCTDEYIAGLFGRDRTTAVYSREWFAARAATDRVFAAGVQQLRGRIARQLEEQHAQP